MKLLQFILSLTITVSLIIVLNTKISVVPPVGKFLDPFHGFWQNAEAEDFIPETALNVKGLKKGAKVIFNKQWIPHIFAENEEDLYFLQGYVTANFRLWQMDFQTMAAAGRISELVGPAAISLDRENRRKGMKMAAENSEKEMMADPELSKVVTAYSEGINSYINSLKYEDLPIEYKLLDYEPELWSPVKCGLLLKYMANNLSFRNSDLEYTNGIQMFDKNTFDLLFPDVQPEQDPIVNGTTEWTFDKVAIDTPSTPFTIANELIDRPLLDKQPADIGSNNWAVAGAKTQSGNPILCGDPHLGLNLPSIWYVVQLTAPGINVYGASLPGSPNVIIGFNDKVAWSVTNALRDVVDWYKIEFKDDTKSEYKLDGEWVKSKMVIEEIKQRGTISYFDTIFHTKWGPVMYDDTFRPGSGKSHCALRWVAHDKSKEAKAFYLLNKAENYKDYREALKHYHCPAQNFVFASTEGDIAMVIQGKFPVKFPNQGKYLIDGTNSENEWQNFIPAEHNVFALNPERNFVSSANQHPVDQSYPYYVFADGYEYYRNRRINTLLDSMNQINANDMMIMQNDNFNLRAKEALPYMLQQIDESILKPNELGIYKELSEWNYINDPFVKGPTFYEIWQDILYVTIWDEFKNAKVDLEWPDPFTTVKLLKEEPDFKLFDIENTDKKEIASDLIKIAFSKMVKRVEKIKTEEGDEKMVWANFKNTTAQHLARLEPFSVPNIPNGGNHNIINATSERHGPSWRIIVELDKNGVHGWGVYPGGQSGNPGSYHYSDLIYKWSKGEYYPLKLLKPEDDKDAGIAFVQEFKPE
ncbi:MAG: penicillin acylase family protein [Flammeovirgaceae bacterium]|nr:penicillin acylase family protein [Flammeovirgaceae bacterium]